MSDQELVLDLPVEPGEPKPWTVQIWVYGSCSDHHFAVREDAVEYAALRFYTDDCSVGDLIAPDGSVDKAAYDEAWERYVSR